MVPLDEIQPNPEQPREVFKAADIASLSASIERHGILAPLVVRRDNGRYVLIAGERRLRAATMAGLSEVPVLLKDVADPKDQLEMALVENLQRADLDPIESAKGYQRLMEVYSYTQDQVAERVGKERPTVANALRLLRLPDDELVAIRDGRISAGHGRALLPLVNPDEMRGVVAKVIAQGLSVRATEKMVRQISRFDPVRRSNTQRRQEKTLDYANKVLSDALHTAVAIKPLKKGGGRIVINYSSTEELERLIAELRAPGTKA
jgi:ParB family chromosome partitioning protein